MYCEIYIRSFLIPFLLILQVHANLSFDPGSYDHYDIVERDVVVVGGGSSGVYTAARLQDYNKSVVIIEKNDYLGGHAETYTDPVTGIPINLGVVVFDNTSTVNNYFSRFNVSLIANSYMDTSITEYIDFSTGQKVDYTPPSNQNFLAALQAYTTQLEKYPLLQVDFNLTHPLPADLLLPFGTFVEKYNLGAFVPTVWDYNQGFSPLLNISTIYMLKYLNTAEVNSFEKGFLTTAHHNTGELYDHALQHFGSDVLLSSNVVAMDRSQPSRVRVVVRTKDGGCKLILAKKLLSTAPPVISGLSGYDLSANETDLFSQFFYNGYYGGVLNNTGLPLNISYLATGPGQPYNLPAPPSIYGIRSAGSENLVQVFYGASNSPSIVDVQNSILAAINKLVVAQGIKNSNPEFVAFTSHAPFNLMVSNEAISNGFYEQLYALNGQRNTFYNGAAWQSQDSSVLWEYTENYVLSVMLASL